MELAALDVHELTHGCKDLTSKLRKRLLVWGLGIRN